jgi:hypothetical protein
MFDSYLLQASCIGSSTQPLKTMGYSDSSKASVTAEALYAWSL